jgi:hypothetical protein
MTILTPVPLKLVAVLLCLAKHCHLSASRFQIGNEILLLLLEIVPSFQILPMGGTFTLILPLGRGWKT